MGPAAGQDGWRQAGQDGGAAQAGVAARFEVASVRPVAEKDRGFYVDWSVWAAAVHDEGCVVVAAYLALAYDVPTDRFAGAPKGLEDAVFDVEVKSEGDVPLTYERLKPLDAGDCCGSGLGWWRTLRRGRSMGTA